MKTISVEKVESKISRRAGRSTILPVAAFLIMASGFLAPFLGLVFFIVHSVLPDDALLGQIGTILMIVSIPLMLCGSHLMDKIDEKTAENSAAEYRDEK